MTRKAAVCGHLDRPFGQNTELIAEIGFEPPAGRREHEDARFLPGEFDAEGLRSATMASATDLVAARSIDECLAIDVVGIGQATDGGARKVMAEPAPAPAVAERGEPGYRSIGALKCV